MAWFIELSLLAQLGLLYFITINIVTFFFFGFDKIQSTIAGRERVSEKRLWLLSFVGGSIGALAGMKFFRHKTRKVQFQSGIAIILAVQIGLIFWYLS